ncbi:MAG: hypothetical protein OXB88_05200, partial [Bacteriovoracales bacterium]|nr:hypothetical protein [Bacteriovoracales bacterium]
MKWMKALILFSLFASYSYAKKEDCVKMGERAQICPGDRVRGPILVHNPEEASKYYEEYFEPRERKIERRLKEYKKRKLKLRNYKGSKSMEILDLAIQDIKNLSMIRK